MKAFRRSFVVGLLGLFASAVLPLGQAKAQDVQDFTRDAAQAVKQLTDRGIAIVQDTTLAPEPRRLKFHELFTNGFDVPSIGRFVLGRYWRTATDDQKKDFLALFEDLVVLTYSNRFTEYSGEQFKVSSARMDQSTALVTTDVVRPSSPEPLRVDWRLINSPTGPKVVDVIVEGVSMSVTQQQDFGSMMQRSGNGIDGLISELRQRAQVARQG